MPHNNQLQNLSGIKQKIIYLSPLLGLDDLGQTAPWSRLSSLMCLDVDWNWLI